MSSVLHRIQLATHMLVFFLRLAICPLEHCLHTYKPAGLIGSPLHGSHLLCAVTQGGEAELCAEVLVLRAHGHQVQHLCIWQGSLVATVRGAAWGVALGRVARRLTTMKQDVGLMRWGDP